MKNLLLSTFLVLLLGSCKKEPEKQVQRNSIDKELKKELQKQKNIFNQLEEKIARLNKQKTQLEADLASPDVYNDRNRFVQTETAYKNDQ